MKIVIIGGVAGGATAAARIRRLDEKAEIIILERSGYVSYANCGLPYYIGGVIEDAKELTLQTPESFRERFRIDVRIHSEALAIDAGNKTVTVRNLKDGSVYEESYDKLILSPGAKPIQPDLPGVDRDRIFKLRTVEDTFRIHDFVKENAPKSAVIVGGGFIGLEVAENLCEMGIRTTIVQKSNQLMHTLDYDMAALIQAKLRKKGVELILEGNVTGFEEAGGRVRVLFDDDRTLKADMVLMAVGVIPDTDIARKAGLKLGIKGSIITDERMETSVKDIYAVGDAVQVKHKVSGADALIALAGPANRQGRIAADNICGGDSRYRGSLGSSVIKIFDMTAASAGLTQRAANEAGLDCDRIVLSPVSHASYYPGARSMVMKIIFEKKSLKLLGAQIIGYEGVDKAIDIIATAISAGIKADELKDLDLAYAPPYSSAKSPVNMAGFMIENIFLDRVKQFHWDEVERISEDKNVILLDTRTEYEYRRGHAKGFINIPVDELRERLGEIDKSKPVYVMCQSGLRSYIACRILKQEGFDCYNFSGGYGFYESVINEKELADSKYPCGIIR